MSKILSIVVLMGLLTISVFAQEPKAIEDSMKATKAITLIPISIPTEMKDALAQVNQSLELARLKKENVILQLRLLLKVPNEFIYSESSMSFDPPKESPKEVKKEEPKEKELKKK